MVAGGADLAIAPAPGTLGRAAGPARRRASCTRSIRSRTTQVKELIDHCQRAGDTLGGVIEVRVEGVPFGLGTHAQWDRKLDGRLAQAVMAVQAIKGVEIGLGFEAARRPGSQVHDPIRLRPGPGRPPIAGLHAAHATTPAGWRPA